MKRTLTRQERHIARLTARLDRLLWERADVLGSGFRCEPLATLLNGLGYTLTPKHPYGRTQQRNAVRAALDALARSGRWSIDYRDLRHLDSSLDRPEGALGDDIWVAYVRAPRPARRPATIITPAEENIP